MKKQDPGPFRILVAPLDWGLGHATRCIPLIRYFQQRGCEVWIAAEGKTQHLLQQEFPQLTYLHLKGYKIRYGSSRAALVGQITRSIPRILQTIRYENHWLREVVSRFHIGAVVSDNRFGLYSRSVPCVYITHQLAIKAPGPIQPFLQKIHYSYIRRFNACWVPDYADSPYLSGELGHPKVLPPVPVHYLGPLSRLEKKSRPIHHSLLFILSGPEPQRTLFEDQILRQLEGSDRTALLVRGLPGGGAQGDAINRLQEAGRLVVYDHLPAAPLAELIASSEWIISRAGYTTVMDLALLQKKSILVPTPGQTEQEYLGRYLHGQGICYTVSQSGFSLEDALYKASAFPYHFPTPRETEDYAAVAGKWLDSIRSSFFDGGLNH